MVLQAAEIQTSGLAFHSVGLERLEHPAWAESAESYEHLALVPLNLLWVCRYDHALVNALSYEASPAVGLQQRQLHALRKLRRSGLSCGALDGLNVCVSPKRPTPLLSALQLNPL